MVGLVLKVSKISIEIKNETLLPTYLSKRLYKGVDKVHNSQNIEGNRRLLRTPRHPHSSFPFTCPKEVRSTTLSRISVYGHHYTLKTQLVPSWFNFIFKNKGSEFNFTHSVLPDSGVPLLRTSLGDSSVHPSPRISMFVICEWVPYGSRTTERNKTSL